jgi:hypothetical protein
VFNDDGTLDFHVTVSGLREIAWWIMGYGDQAEVIQPQELRELVIRRAKDVDGRELLARLAGQDRVAAEPAAAAEIVQYCHGIPLALRIAGTILAYRPARPVSWLAQRLAPERYRLDELSFGGESLRDLYSSAVHPISADRDPLVDAALRLLGRPGFEVCGITEASVALGVCPMRIEAALDRLVDLGLAEWAGHDTYRLPPLMRLFASELGAEIPPQRSATPW